MSDDFWFVNAIDVQPRTGHDGHKPTYGPVIRDVPCALSDVVQTVRDSSGNETTSTSTVYLSIEDARRVPVESKVNTGTREAYVIRNAVFDSGSLDWDDLDHAVLHLT